MDICDLSPMDFLEENYLVKSLYFHFEFRSNRSQIGTPNILQLFNSNIQGAQEDRAIPGYARATTAGLNW
jgi:hypothetical protein